MKTILILSPRILLSFQLLRVVSKYLITNNKKCNYINVNSGEFNEVTINEFLVEHGFEAGEIPSTTSPKVIKEFYEKSKKLDKNLVISSTYHSAEQIRLSGIKIDLQINDEAHILVSDRHHGIIECPLAQNVISFTATQKITDDPTGMGMNNEEYFGNTIYSKSPLEMINEGEIIKPALHLISPKGLDKTIREDYKSQIGCIKHAFEQHKIQIKKQSSDASKIGAKLLVTCESQKALENMFVDLVDYKNANNIKLYAMSSDFGIFLNGSKIKNSNSSKEEFLKSIQTLKDNDDAIILHVDMLGEGLDVTGITGVLLFKNLGVVKFLQNLGRACRLHDEDRKSLYSNKFKPAEIHKYIKPYAWVIIPKLFMESKDSEARYKEYIRALRDDYGYSPYENVIIEEPTGTAENEPDSVDTAYKSKSNKKCLIKEFYDTLDNEIDLNPTIDKFAMIDMIKYPNSEVVFNSIGHWDIEYSVFKDCFERGMTYIEMIKKQKKLKKGVFSDETIKKYGTVYTPEFVVKATNDLVWKYLPTDKNPLDLTYCDPACGDGNFLIDIYDRLMKEPSKLNRIDKSYHILTKCLFGIEILQTMWMSSKLRLLNKHFEVCKQEGIDVAQYVDLHEQLRIYWGNAILKPIDTLNSAHKRESENEGGLLLDKIRNQKYDVIIGNPPYTHLRNLGNRKYAAYPRQRDLAQVFVRWALDHMTEDGVVGYNTIDTWLDVKITDGALETRKLTNSKLAEYRQNDKIMRYSENDGGSIPTCIFIIINNKETDDLILNNKKTTTQNMYKPGFIKSIRDSDIDYKYKNVPITRYVAKINGVRSNNKHGTKTQKSRFKMVFGDGEFYYLLSKGACYEHTYEGNWRLLKMNSLNQCKSFAMDELESESKITNKLDKKPALWLLGFLNTQIAKKHVYTYTKQAAEHGGWCSVFISGLLWLCQVPNFDYYSTNYPERTKTYLDWIETNMHDKDVFLAGIDEQFENLIKE